MRILILFVQYGDADYTGALKNLLELYDRIDGVEIDVVAVDTLISWDEGVCIGPDMVMIGGDNSRREFSGWDTAIARYSYLIDDYGLINIVTSAFGNEYNGFYDKLEQRFYRFAVQHDAVLGHVDAYPESVRLAGRSFQTWVCSKFLLITPRRLRSLKSMVGLRNVGKYFTSDPVASPFSDSAPMSANYRNYIQQWLTGGGLPHGEWHSTFDLDENSLPRFVSKAVSILDEHSLSMRIREMCVPIVDFTWLSAQGQLDELNGIPDEIQQVQERNAYLFDSAIIERDLYTYDQPVAVTYDWQLASTPRGDSPFEVTPLISALWLGSDSFRSRFDLEKNIHLAAISVAAEIRLNLSQLEWMRQPDPQVVQDGILPITRGLHALCLSRIDLSCSIDIKTQQGRKALIIWWMLSGMDEAEPGLYMGEEVYNEAFDGIEQDACLPLTRGLCALHQARPDLNSKFDISTRDGRDRLVRWWITSCLNDPRYSRLVAVSDLHAVDDTLEQDAMIRLSRGLVALHRSRQDLSESMDITIAEGRNRLVAWWITSGRLEPQAQMFMPDAFYLEADDSIPQDANMTLTRGVVALHRFRDDLAEAFDIARPQGRQGLVDWCLRNDSELIVAAQKENFLADVSSRSCAGRCMSSGVNLIGFGHGELGIGEDVRMASEALCRFDIDHCAPAISMTINASQNSTALNDMETSHPLYNINMVMLPTYETLQLAGSNWDRIFRDRYNIACWQWELPSYPVGMELALDLVDEIWSSTEYTAQAMRDATDKPVRIMPMTVALPEPKRRWSRGDFGLPEEDFLFIFVMDGNSSVYRKNPLAVVEAFRLAFSPGMRGMHLVIKTMNMEGVSSAEWNKVVNFSGMDERITLLNEIYSRDKVLGLHSIADSLVSLHRAEGFGRNIAESMLLGKPVIVSRFSGNLDFTSDKTAFMVDGELVTVKPHEYHFSDGQRWFDVDIVSAADAMRRCLEDQQERKRKAAAGKQLILTKYSADSVGSGYVDRLSDISRSLSAR